MSSFDLIQFAIDLIGISQKASKLAQFVRNSDTFDDLKNEKDHPVVQDFKTVSDVLIQEMIRYDVSKYCPKLADRVYGEEDAKFTNKKGEVIDLTISSLDKKGTTSKIMKALDCKEEFASSLMESIYEPIKNNLGVTPVKEVVENLIGEIDKLPYNINDIGIWTDPIDGTNEYVIGNDPKESLQKFAETLSKENQPIKLLGSKATSEILIGVFDINTKKPIFGLINSPFHICANKNIIIAGLNMDKKKWYYIPKIEDPQMPFGLKDILRKHKKIDGKLLVTSGKQDAENISRMGSGMLVLQTAGAGFKILSVILGQMDIFFKSDNLIYLYDVCGPLAILYALGGGMASVTDVLALAKDLNSKNDSKVEEIVKEHLLKNQIKFSAKSSDVGERALNNGMIAYLDIGKAAKFLSEYSKKAE